MAAVADIYVEEVRKRAEAAACHCTAAREDPDDAAAAAATEPFTCNQRHASELSLSEARAHVARFQPLVITDVEEITDPWPWTLDWLVATIGSKRAAVNVGGSQTAGVSVAGTEVVTISELADRINHGECVYLYDCSIPLKLPALTERLGVPAWFAHDWLHRTRERHAFSRSWPSLFIGAPGTRSSLHIDQ
jgi:solute carrier family 25 thiamine pyrophosphate transporter 19